MDFEKHIEEIESKIGYTFKDKSLLIQAFTRTSFCNEHKGAGGEKYQSNEVLEFFGDSALSLAIVTLIIKDLSERYSHGIKTELTEGDFSNIRSKLSDKKNLSERMRGLGLSKYLKMGEGDAKLGIENEPSVMEDLFESIIGAIYIDSGMDMPRVVKIVSKLLSVKEYMSARTAPIQSYKNALQEFCASKTRRLPQPEYKTESENGPEHKKTYFRACYIGDKKYAVGIGKNQKLADADAAEKTLKMLMVEEEKKKKPAASDTAVEQLVAYLSSAHLSGASFYDLGEAENSSPTRPTFKVSCKVGDKICEGEGASKKNARCESAAKMLSLLKKQSKTQGKKTSGRGRVKNKT